MSGDIVLSKIAEITNKQQQNNNEITFQYKDKNWVLLDAFNNEADTIMKLMETCKRKEVKNFAFVQSDDEHQLLVVYRNNIRFQRNQNSEHLIDQLLGSLYFDLKTVHQVHHETKVLKTYVTTKLFEALHKQHISHKAMSQQMLNILTIPTKFLPTLCEYQKKSVQWLLLKEHEPDIFPAFFEKLQAKDNATIVYKHSYSRYMQKDQPPDICLPPGGILADEMGLGKTVEMLALILLNPRTDVSQNEDLWDLLDSIRNKRKCMDTKVFCICTSNSKKEIIQCNKCFLWQHTHCVGHDDVFDEIHKPYLCPNCWQISIDECGLFKTKATLIVSPNTIKLQWLSEIRRHINPPLRVFLYDGVLSKKWISPWQLAEYDIVLTDYTALRGEIYFTQENVSERTTRNKPLSMRINTPILMLNWWRVLLDEAQMVESNTSKVASLVRMIPAINRWAVTGTPIQKSLNDLHPLLQFIGFDAACDNATWSYLVNDFVLQQDQLNSEENDNIPVPALINVLQKCMWRTCKTQIASELNIPPQQEIVHRIEFDNLEKLFYNEQHAECRSNFMVNVHKYTMRMKTISPQIMKIILQPFLKIRQSCTIPVVVSNTSTNSNFTSHQQKQFLQPRELHDYLKSSNEISCKSELRAMASSHNGLAALYFLNKNYDQAIKHYESVLKLANDYNDMNIAVDSLLQIHALHNIMQIKIIKNPQTMELNLETYDTQYNALEWKYLGTYANILATVKTSYEVAVDKINPDISENFLISMSGGLENLPTNDESLLLQKIHEECAPRFAQTNFKLAEVQSTRSLLYVVQLWFHKLKNILKVVLHEIDALKYFSENVRSRNQVSPATWREVMYLVNTVYDCHLSEIREVQNPNKKSKPTEKEKQLCKMCCIRNSMNTFECLLFDKVIDKNTNDTEGLENASFEMFLCKLTFNFLKNKQRGLSEVMEQSWSYLENLQLVCKRLIKLWIEMEYTIKAYDELNMCKMRITLTTDPDDKSIFKIMQNDIDDRILEQQNELMTAQTKFNVKLARLKYIKHLEGDDDPGACPICQLSEEDRYAVLECGHHICFQCLKTIRHYTKGSKFKCSICRNVQQNQNIYYVSRTKTNTSESEKIKGDYSSKITYIVRLILKIINEKHDDPNQTTLAPEMERNVANSDIKILIFSQWEPILLSIALALKENNIKFRAQCTARTIEEFKNPNLGITCLLMPFVRGSKGLNLVEATHVFLVEPILNPGEELQAIGRVHRFGQTRPTAVHRFIVRDSIEENIYNFIVSSSNSNNSKGIQRRWEFENISLKDFENLFSLQRNNFKNANLRTKRR